MDNKNVSYLWQEFLEKRSMEARNNLMLSYIHLVKSIVRRMVPTYKNHVDYDDLMSCGVLGLMDALEKFDPKKNVKFETYASLRIKGEIIDQIRKQDWAPISLRQKIKKVEEGYSSLEAKFGRAVTDSEVADYLSMNVSDINKTLDEAHTFNVLCLDELISDRVKSEEYLGSWDDSPEQNYENMEMKQILAGLIDELPEKERIVISLYYTEELTLKEIGEVLGVSESRVSQIHSKTLMTLRGKMQSALS